MRTRLVTAALALTVALPVHAQTQFTLTGAGSVAAFGYYVGPYSVMAGSGPSAQNLFMTCVDFAHQNTIGETWTAVLTNLGTGAGIGTNTRSSDLTLYREAAWLTSQFAGKTNAEIGDIQATIWNLFDAAAPDPSSSFWLIQAQNNYASMDYSGFYVVTDVNKGLATSAQEGLILATPEPATVTLMMSGLAGLYGVARRRKSRV